MKDVQQRRDEAMLIHHEIEARLKAAQLPYLLCILMPSEGDENHSDAVVAISAQLPGAREAIEKTIARFLVDFDAGRIDT